MLGCLRSRILPNQRLLGHYALFTLDSEASATLSHQLMAEVTDISSAEEAANL